MISATCFSHGQQHIESYLIINFVYIGEVPKMILDTMYDGISCTRDEKKAIFDIHTS